MLVVLDDEGHEFCFRAADFHLGNLNLKIINMGKSSKDKRDGYYRFAKEEHYRSRSAYKLRQISRHFKIFEGVSRAVDLCAAPGGWTQVVSQRLKNCIDVKIVAVDVQPMAPLDGVIHIEGDITEKNTACSIIDNFSGSPADLVLCDGSPDVIKMYDFDEYLQGQILLAAFNIMCNILIPGGTFLAKIFRGKDTPLLVKQFKAFFKDVVLVKPSSSRNSSIECYVLCRNFSPPSEFTPSMEKPLLSLEKFSVSRYTHIPYNYVVDGASHDTDGILEFTLDENEEYKPKDPVQRPIMPPYAVSIALNVGNKKEYPLI